MNCIGCKRRQVASFKLIDWFIACSEVRRGLSLVQRAEHIVGRLKNASSTILTFGEVKPEARPERDEENEEDGFEEDDIEEKIFK